MVDVTAAGCTIAGLDGGKTELEDGPMIGPIGTNAELVGTGAEVIGTGAELAGTGDEPIIAGAELVGFGAELIVTSAELVETSVGMIGIGEKGEAPNDDNANELLLADVGIIENPGKEGVLVKLPDVVDTEGAGRE